jgi:hypothetical protein
MALVIMVVLKLTYYLCVLHLAALCGRTYSTRVAFILVLLVI